MITMMKQNSRLKSGVQAVQGLVVMSNSPFLMTSRCQAASNWPSTWERSPTLLSKVRTVLHFDLGSSEVSGSHYDLHGKTSFMDSDQISVSGSGYAADLARRSSRYLGSFRPFATLLPS